MTENPEKPKQVTRLIIQAGIPVEDILDGEELYRQLKEMLKSYSVDTTLNGQIVKMLEPCCKDKTKGTPDDKSPKTM